LVVVGDESWDRGIDPSEAKGEKLEEGDVADEAGKGGPAHASFHSIEDTHGR